jgi:hypothetical protein
MRLIPASIAILLGLSTAPTAWSNCLNNPYEAPRAIGCCGGAGGIADGVRGHMQSDAAQAQANRPPMTGSVTKGIDKENAEPQAIVETARRSVDGDQKKQDQIKSEPITKTISLGNAEGKAAGIPGNTTQISVIPDAAHENRDSQLAAGERYQGRRPADCPAPQ